MKNIEISDLKILCDRIKNWQILDQNSIQCALLEFEQVPRLEWSSFRIDLLSDSVLAKEFVLIGDKYYKNQKKLRSVISSLGNMIERYNLDPSDHLYNYF